MSNEFLDPAGDPLGSEQQPPEIEGGHAGRLARAAVIQQVAQVARLAAGLIVVTVLVRKLPLSEFGTYTILISLVTYVMFLKQSVMNAAIVGVASAGRDEDGVSTVVSTGLAVYTVLGVLS